MNLEELYNKAIINEDVVQSSLFQQTVPGYQDLDADNTTLNKTDKRKTTLTLSHIAKMRQINDIRNYEMNQKLELIQAQYGPQASSDGDDMGF